MNSYSKQVSNQQQEMQIYERRYQQLQPHFTPCYTCSVYGHLSKNCPQQDFTQQNYSRNTTPVATPPYLGIPNIPTLVFPRAYLPNSFPRLSNLQQIIC